LGTRLVLMTLIWLGLSGADWSSWIVGGPVVLAAAWISARLLPPTAWHWSFTGTMAFAGFFLRESLRGGWDVARRALSPDVDLRPAVITYRVRLPAGAARLFLVSVIGLLPGTAVVAISEGQLFVHVLEASPQVDRELQRLERRVGALFGLALPHGTEAPS